MYLNCVSILYLYIQFIPLDAFKFLVSLVYVGLCHVPVTFLSARVDYVLV